MAGEFGRFYAVVSGRVQGVSFRYYTLQTARQAGVTGWVRNRPDGKVEVTAEGQKDQLEVLLRFLHQGPPAARVERVEVTWQEAVHEFEQFTVRL